MAKPALCVSVLPSPGRLCVYAGYTDGSVCVVDVSACVASAAACLRDVSVCADELPPESELDGLACEEGDEPPKKLFRKGSGAKAVKEGGETEVSVEVYVLVELWRVM
ncbi:MAG: hypothetical protein P4L40_25725 [Terracidiphilus sp.]|nr:hypothetical protein [Terracidiphilus sp.]